MFNYVVKRIFVSIITVWVVVTVTFLLMHAIPGGPFDREKKLPKEVKAQIEARYNLDKSLFWQYKDYFGKLLQGDMGPSFQYPGRTVQSLITDGFPITATLGIISVLLAVLVGVPFGVIAGLKQGKWQDNLVMFLSTIGITVPGFVMAILLLYFFGFRLALFPMSSWGTWKHAVLPAIALAASPIAMIARLTRSSLLDVIRQDYIRTARAKGVQENSVIFKHALKNALIPVMTYLGPLVAGVLTGSFVIETLFSIPGMGRQFVESINNRDFTAIIGLTIFDAIILISFNFIVDLLYAVVDPRIKY